jgi:hypothetical protein
LALKFVPKELITEEMCKIAIKSPCALEYVPYSLKTELCKSQKSYLWHGYATSNIPN